MSDAPLGPTVFNDRYEVHRKLARGGMADVYLARDLLLDRPVAVKVLFPEHAGDATFVERFRREAKAAANLNHPNIVAVYDWGEQLGTYFIVMEYVEGRPLSDIIHADGAAPPAQAAEITAEVAAALAFAHDHGVVHRDIKPGNILITTTGQVKVADFGIAQAAAAEATQASLTQVGAVMGTATYFSPEQAQGRPVDPRSDLYSLGCVLYEMLTGRPPFTGDSPVAIAYQHVQSEPTPPRALVPTLPPALEAVDLRLLAKDPAHRYPSAEALRADLRRFLEGRPLAPAGAAGAVAGAAAAGAGAAADLTRAIPATGAGGAPPAGPGPPYGDPPGEPRRGRGALVAGLIVLLGALAVVLVVLGMRLTQGADQVTVPDVQGLAQEEATARLAADGFDVDVRQENNAEVPAGAVIRQDPVPLSRVDEGSTVTIVVSAGLGQVEVPDVQGRSSSAAVSLIEQADLIPDPVERNDPSVAAGEVISQEPPGGTMVQRRSTVRIYVSSGPGEVRVPNVAGRTPAEARATLEGAGLGVSGQREAPSTSVEAGRVVGTDPPAGDTVARGASVVLVVSSGPPPSTTTTTTPPTTTTEATTTTTTTTPPTTTTEPPPDD